VDYQAYYYAKYQHSNTEKLPIQKFKKLVSSISLDTDLFMPWLWKAIDNTNQFLDNEKEVYYTQWNEEQLHIVLMVIYPIHLANWPLS